MEYFYAYLNRFQTLNVFSDHFNLSSSEIQTIIEKENKPMLESLANSSDEICKLIGKGVRNMETTCINMNIIKEFDPQCQVVSKN